VPTKITFIHDVPEDVDAFETRYAGHLDLVRALPGATRVEAAKVWPKEDGSRRPAHRVVDVWFADYDAAVAATRSEAAQALFPAAFGLGPGGVTILFSDVETAQDL
jgi:uncharacterized protein (TIGR02118 family)